MIVSDKTVVYLLGDSITQGLGSKKVNFAGELAHLLGDAYEIVNLAYTGTTIDYALKLLDDGKIVPRERESVCVILYVTSMHRYALAIPASCFRTSRSASKAGGC